MIREHLKFQNPETGEYTKQFQDFYDEVGEYDCPNYDCNQVARAIEDGLTPYQAAKQFNRDYNERSCKHDWETIFDHDMSMNY